MKRETSSKKLKEKRSVLLALVAIFILSPWSMQAYGDITIDPSVPLVLEDSTYTMEKAFTLDRIILDGKNVTFENETEKITFSVIPQSGNAAIRIQSLFGNTYQLTVNAESSTRVNVYNLPSYARVSLRVSNNQQEINATIAGHISFMLTETTEVPVTITVTGVATPANSPPYIVTLVPKNIADTIAYVSAKVTPSHNATAIIRYGTTYTDTCSESFGSVAAEILTTDSSSEYVTLISNLVPNTTYYVCSVAKNAYGVAFGNVVSFTTLSEESANLPGNLTNETISPIMPPDNSTRAEENNRQETLSRPLNQTTPRSIVNLNSLRQRTTPQMIILALVFLSIIVAGYLLYRKYENHKRAMRFEKMKKEAEEAARMF